MQNRTISVIGLGKLGLCLAASFAKRGWDVLGVDVLPEVVNALNQGRSKLCEPGLAELLSEFGGKSLRGTLSHLEAIEQTDISCVLVHTPSEDDGNFSNQYVLKAIEALGTALRNSSKPYHLFIINSTVMPGTMEKAVIPLLEKTSKRRVNEGFGVCYCPEVVALGSVIRDFLKPDMVANGCSNEPAGQLAESVYERLCENQPPIFRMSLIDAELFKISLNAFITLKISFANSLANLCERVSGANVDAITKVLGTDRRIAPYYLQGGLAYGGTCFPRDTKAYIALARRHGMEATVIEAVDAVNRSQDRRLLDLVLEHINRSADRAVSVLGLAFKPNTNVIVGSPGIKLIEELLKRRVRIVAYDPLAIESTRAHLGDTITYAGSIRECVASSPICVITTPDKTFKEIDPDYLTGDSCTLIDCWRLLTDFRPAANTTYIPLGVNMQVPIEHFHKPSIGTRGEAAAPAFASAK
jgi:UDPglucose 6-dehydrogenase